MQRKDRGYTLGAQALREVFGVLGSPGGAANWKRTWLGRLLTALWKSNACSDVVFYKMAQRAQTGWSQGLGSCIPWVGHVAVVVQVQAPLCLEDDLSQKLRGVGHQAPRCSADTQCSKFRVVGKLQWKTGKAGRSRVPWAWTGEHIAVWSGRGWAPPTPRWQTLEQHHSLPSPPSDWPGAALCCLTWTDDSGTGLMPERGVLSDVSSLPRSCASFWGADGGVHAR